MAASQNVLAAVKGGIVAILAGASTVAASFAIVGIFIRIGNPGSNSEE
jgi:hypothetical protein